MRYAPVCMSTDVVMLDVVGIAVQAEVVQQLRVCCFVLPLRDTLLAVLPHVVTMVVPHMQYHLPDDRVEEVADMVRHGAAVRSEGWTERDPRAKAIDEAETHAHQKCFKNSATCMYISFTHYTHITRSN
jgi:hypothetical protein